MAYSRLHEWHWKLYASCHAIVTGVIIRNLPSKASKVEAVNNIIIMLSIAFLGKRFTFAAVWCNEFWLTVCPQGLSAPWIWHCHPQAPGSAAYQLFCRWVHTATHPHLLACKHTCSYTQTHTHTHETHKCSLLLSPFKMVLLFFPSLSGFYSLPLWHYFPLRHMQHSHY